MSKKYELDVKDIVGGSFKTTIANCGYVNKYGTSIIKSIYSVMQPLTPETTNWYYQVTVKNESKLETTSLRAAVEEYNKY
jgi:hypothetical protein